MTFAYSVGPRTWDPHPETRAFVYGWYSLIYEGLLTTDVDGHIVPGLATSWHETADSVTLTLRSGTRFHDGTTFDSQAVAWNLTTQQGQQGTQPVLKRIEKIETPSPDQVVLHLSAPSPGLLPQLASFAGLMVSPAVGRADLEQGAPAGTGPYVLDRARSQKDTNYVFTPFADYTGPQPAVFGRVDGRVMADDVSRSNALLSHRVDAAFLPSSQAADLDGRVPFSSARTYVQVLMLLDAAPEGGNALADPRVRQAIAMSIDRSAFDRAVNFGRSHPQAELLEEGLAGHVDDYAPPPYDPEAARALLAEAGNPDIRLTMPVQGGFKLGAEALASMLDQIGVRVDLVAVSAGQDTAGVLAGRFSSTYTFIPDTVPESIYSKFLSPTAPFNPFEVVDPTIEQAHSRATAAPAGSAEQQTAYRDMMRALYDAGRIIPLARVDTTIGYDDSRVQGIHAWSGVSGFFRVTDARPAN